MKLSSIKAPKGSRRKKKRLGMGPGSGTGKTSGKGHKGQNSRSGGGVKPWFEGGQMPLQMRLPKIGFNSTRPDNQVLNVSDLARKELSGEVTIEVLKKSGLISSLNKPVKILGVGDLTHSLQVQEGIKVSASALEKIAMGAARIDNHAAERNPATAHMFIINPLHAHKHDNLFATHPATENRIAALRAMTPDGAPVRTQSARPTSSSRIPKTGRRRDAGPWR